MPVLTVDGPTASGKGTLAHELAESLGYHVLTRGAVPRHGPGGLSAPVFSFEDGASLAASPPGSAALYRLPRLAG